MLISTTFDLAGYDVSATLGEVFGLTVRARNVGAAGISDRGPTTASGPTPGT